MTSARNTGGLEQSILAGGFPSEEGAQFARNVIAVLAQSDAVHFISLDADRAYPKKTFQIHEIAHAYDIDWGTSEYRRGRSYKPTTTLYDEWLKYFLAQESQSGTKLIQETRRARESGMSDPVFDDHFREYKTALRTVLPHLIFSGVDSKNRTLVFDSTGVQLSFNQLSGGERELAFLIGQIDRFRLRNGLFLLDEPELHLNPDLIRTWVSYLTGAVTTGQVWLATHSLEAVEAAGRRSTFVLEREDDTRKVNRIARLDERPLIAALSRAVGSPAFSLSKLKFVFVEGEDSIGERQRFLALCARPMDVRFIPSGSSKEVLRRVHSVRAVSSEGDAGLAVGGIIDRDRLDARAASEGAEQGIFVLDVQEVENLFLFPGSILELLKQNGRDNLVPLDIIRSASDQRAGSWIFQFAMAQEAARSLPEIGKTAKDFVKRKDWQQMCESDVVASIVSGSGFAGIDAEAYSSSLKTAIDAYALMRAGEDVWKCCDGKEVFRRIASAVGFSSPETLEQATLSLWERRPELLPDEVRQLRAYVDSL